MTTPLRPGIVGKPLTPKQQCVWDLKNEGKTVAQIASELGVSQNTVQKKITYIRRKLGLAVREAPPPGSSTDARSSKMLALAKNHVGPPELVENAVDKVNQAMQDAGFRERVRASLVRRLKVKHGDEETIPHRPNTQEITGLIEEKIHLGLTYMDDKVFSEASFRDLSVGVSALIEKRALLRGEPTQILSNHERAKLHELLPLAIAEAQRRGLTIPGTVTEKTIEPA